MTVLLAATVALAAGTASLPLRGVTTEVTAGEAIRLLSGFQLTAG